MMTIEMLQARIKELEKSKEQLIAQLNMHMGAIEDCNHWIEQLKSKNKQDLKVV